MATSPDSADPIRAALRGRCPRCGKGKLFSGALGFSDRCSSCGLDIAGFNVGDGPAAFLVLVIGFLVVGLAMWLEFSAHPPWWLHVLIWPPLIVGLTILGLRFGKAILLALEYRHKAAEGRLKD